MGRQSMHNVRILVRNFNGSELEFQVFQILVYRSQARVWDTASHGWYIFVPTFRVDHIVIATWLSFP